MKFLNRCLFIIAVTILSLLTRVCAQNVNAPVISGDFADPSIIKAKDKYYAVATSSEWAPHYPIFSSADLQEWQQEGYVFDKAPEWTSGSFWAPEYFFLNNTYYIYYTARRKTDNVSCIGVATSKYPDKGFKDHGAIVEFGKEAIDAFIFKDNNQLYITFKAYGLDNRPIEILANKLSADGLRMEGEVFSLLKDDTRSGLEGQSILKKDGYYYLFYSAGNCCGGGCSYNVKVARAKTFKGPYEKLQNGGTLLSEDENWKCMGHGTFVTADNNEQYYLFHAYNKNSDVFTGREGLLARLSWNQTTGWPALDLINSSIAKSGAISDDFDGKTPASYWQYDFRNTTPVIKQKKGSLILSGDFKNTSQVGIVLATRPASNKFEMETEVLNSNEALKGLVFYGDASAAIGVGVIRDKVEFWMVKDNKRSIVDSASINLKHRVQLKFSSSQDRNCKVFYKQNGGNWIEMALGSSISIDFLPPWDRSPRVGVNFNGRSDLDGRFAYFELRYQE